MKRSKIKEKANYCLLLFILLSIKSYPQNFSTIGKEFVFGVMQNGGLLPQNVTIFVNIAAYKSNVTGVISSPFNNFQQNFSLPQDSCLTLILPSFLINDSSEQISNKGIRITANDTIAVSTVNENSGSSDGAAIYPITAVYNEYFDLGYSLYLDSGFYFSEFLIVAQDTATQINIVPNDTTANGVLPGDTIHVTLNAQQTYLVKSHTDLIGTKVWANKPFALFGGAIGVHIPIYNCCSDHLYEQIIPNQYWDTSFISIPLMGRLYGDTYRIMARDNNTNVYFDNSFHAVLNGGQYVEDTIVNATHITADKPIAVVQFSNSSSYDGGSASDPFMIQLHPVQWLNKKAIFRNIASSDFLFYYINIMVKNTGINSVYLDGVNINSGLFAPVVNSDYSWISVMIDTSTSVTHILTSDSGFVAYHYGNDYFNSYGYPLSGYGGNISTGVTVIPKPFISILYPNPFKESTTLRLPYAPINGDGFNLTVFDAYGKVVKQINKIHKTTIEIKTEGLKQGVYFYKLSGSNGNLLTTGKMMVE